MRTHAIKKLVEQLFSEQANKWGYSKNASLYDFFTKTHPDGILTGIFPRLIRKNYGWKVEFFFATLHPAIENEIRSFGGEILRGPVYPAWTYCTNNLRSARFPADYFQIVLPGNFVISPSYDAFGFDLDEAKLTERMKVNFNIIESYSLPWLNELSIPSAIAEQLQIYPGYDDVRLAIAHYLNQNFELAKSTAKRSQFNETYPPYREHPFYEKFYAACELQMGMANNP